MGYTEDVFEALDIQDRLQTLYTSGTVFHTFLGEKLPDWKSAAALVRKIAENYQLPYYTLSPTYSVCADHGYLTGEQYTCPICGRKTEVYSRITGYYRPVQNWNDGKAQEFKDRKTYAAFGAPASLKVEAPLAETPAQAAPSQGAVTGRQLIVTKTCPNCRIVKPMLDRAAITYEVMDAAEHTDLVEHYGITQAPTLIVHTTAGDSLFTGVLEIRQYIKQAQEENQ